MTDELATVETTNVAGVAYVVVAGEVDRSNAAGLLGRLLATIEDSPATTVDLSRVGYLDSSGVALVHDLRRRARALGRVLELVAVDGSNARRVLELSGLEDVLVNGSRSRP